MSPKVSHIGLVVRDLELSIRFWTQVMGFAEVHRTDVRAEGVRTAMLAGDGAGSTSLELIEPIEKDDLTNPIARRLHHAGEGFYHLAVIDEDAAARARLLASDGAAVIERPPAELGTALAGRVRAGAARHVVHPRNANGVLIEVLQQAG